MDYDKERFENRVDYDENRVENRMEYDKDRVEDFPDDAARWGMFTSRSHVPLFRLVSLFAQTQTTA